MIAPSTFAMVSPAPTGPAPKFAPAAEGKGFLDFLELDVDSDDLDDLPGDAPAGNAGALQALTPMAMPMPVPAFVLPGLPHSLHVVARPIQIPGLPAGPDAPTVEVLTQPAPPKGEVAFQLQMTTPDETLLPADAAREEVPAQGPFAEVAAQGRRAEIPAEAWLAQPDLPRVAVPVEIPRRRETSASTARPAVPAESRRLPLPSGAPLPEIAARPRRPEPPAESIRPQAPQAHPVSHAATSARKAPMPSPTPTPKRSETLVSTDPRPTAEPAPQTSVIAQPVSTPADAPADPVAPPQEVAPARPVEVVEEPPRPATPAQHIALRVKSVDDRSVDVRLTSRAGEVHVSVHTPDAALARTMRTELGTLTGKLSQAGFGVQNVSTNSAESSSSSDQRESNPDHNRDARHYQQHHEQQQDAQQNRRGRRQVPFLFDWEVN